MNTGNWRARALIDGRALRHNLAIARRLAPDCRVMAVIKSGAYGHGMAEVSRALAGRVDAFAVATLQEGIDCRAAHPAAAVTLLSGLQQPADLELCRRQRLDPVLHDEEHLRWVEQCRAMPPSSPHSPSPWLKIDTGMNRLGLAPAQVAGAIARLRRCRVKRIRLMSHLACADDTGDRRTEAQLRRFRRATDAWRAEGMARSLANSAAVMRWPRTHFEWVRPGIMLYGGSPLLGCRGPQLGLQPAMRLEARLLSVKTARKGEAVGYGGDFVAPRRMPIGVVGFGYGDGYPRVFHGAGGAPAVLIGGARAPLLGRVSMDMLTVDLSACKDPATGQTVTLWGGALSVDEVAGWAGTISYELLCKINSRVERVLVNPAESAESAE